MRYVLEGSMQNAGERMRSNVQLVDAESGGHVWAERFDKARADLLDVQDEVTARLARTIHIELIAAESRRAAREHPDRLDSVDHTLRGWAAWHRHLSLEGARQARLFFETALRLDENNRGALLGLANAHMSEVNMYASSDRAGQIRAAEAAAAAALAPENADARVTYGTVLFAMRAPERALREFAFAVSLDGNLAMAHAYIGLMTFLLGRGRDPRPCRASDAAQSAAFKVFAADAADHHGSASAVERRVTAAPIHRSSPPSDRSARLYSRWRRDVATGRLECTWLIDHATRAGSTNVTGRLPAITGASVLVFVGGPRRRA